MSEPLTVNSRILLPGNELSWRAVAASGPGGQNVNKVATKVELRFHLASSTGLDPGTKQRLRAIAGGRLDSDGNLVIVCQQARSQRRNLEIARALLTELVRQATIVPRRRRPTKPSVGAQRRRLERKRQRSDLKRARRWSDETA